MAKDKLTLVRAPGKKVIDPSSEQGFPSSYLVTPDETAAALRTTKKAIYSMAARNQLPGVVRIGRRLLFRRDVLLHWLSEKSGTPSPEGERR